ncbi:MAG: glycosyltransferase family 4 protein [Planctomycetaceae bacterium]|nr:glycosyltransferase family 4 protein [Planctomycetaceae bacterium]
MKLTFLYDHRYILGADGKPFSLTHYNYGLFANRYLPHFDTIDIVARCDLPLGERAHLGPGVDFVSIGTWNGAIEYFQRKSAIRNQLAKLLATPTAVIMIVPGRLGEIARPLLLSQEIPYGVEVVGDPWGALGPGTSRHPLRPLMRWHCTHHLKKLCRDASCASYVTREVLQRIYPASNASFQTHYSSIELTRADLVDAPRQYTGSPAPHKLVCIGTMAHLYKGQDVLLDALALCRQQIPNIQLTLVGDGVHRPSLEARTERLGLQHCVAFLGKLPPGEAIKQQLDAADLYVLPTRGEGLPRTIIEAMARGMACLGTRVSGVPELLPEDCLVAPDNARQLASKIVALLRDPARMTALGAANLQASHDYLSEELVPRRSALYQELVYLCNKRWNIVDSARKAA